MNDSAVVEPASLKLLEVDGETVEVRPGDPQSWEATLAVLEDDDDRAALQIAFESADPAHWRLLHFVAMEVFPALARQPIDDSVLGIKG